ncbi:ABC transporter permease [uncultured Maricaulis sp.]|uniref:ABC transporter permease n=1 Tax=uncultured Maricaulis sp. TaxID=174710 RepID=UPI0030D884BA|tara:strand:- start:59683 stop:60837 length:1155 start_codon:yes stop_codon:yes gene_type:complete
MRGNQAKSDTGARVDLRDDAGKTVVEAHGDWTIDTISRVDTAIRNVETSVEPDMIVVDLTQLGRVDTSGAYMLGRVTRRCGVPDGDFHYLGRHPTARRLIEEVRRRSQVCPPDPPRGFGFVEALERIGSGLEAAFAETIETIAFFGQTITTGLRTLVRPSSFRLTSTIWAMEEVGVNALPIVAVLSFFIGAVVAYMGANLLAEFGFAIFSVELIGISVLREFAVLITAILLAGRSDSAFTASIGAMKMQQEIDAMKVLGLNPFEVLVLPRVVACVLMAPLLTFAAMITGIFGGMLVAWTAQDISPAVFIARLHSELDWSHFWVGMSKAPVFGLVVAIVGCRQGMKVAGDVESLGRRVTASVVQSIFIVIVVEAMFAMMYLELGI